MKHNKFKFKFGHKFAFVSAVLLVASALLFNGCTLTRKINAAEILSKTKLEFASLSLDSVTINDDLFPQKGFGGGFLPNPQVIAMVQNFAKGILEKEIGKAGLTAILVADNQSTDTLWIKNLNATLKLDSLMELPITLSDTLKLVPGKNLLKVITQMPIDKRLFKLKDIQEIRMLVKTDVSLVAAGEKVELDFNVARTFSQEEKQALAEKARTSVLNSIVNDWVGAILPQD